MTQVRRRGKQVAIVPRHLAKLVQAAASTRLDGTKGA